MQSRVANSITKRINTSFDTNIGIGEAKIDLRGNLRLGNVIIKDHKEDTLFYVKAIRLKLEEFEAVLNGEYSFSDLRVDQPYVAIKTHLGEEQTNLKQFFQKLKRNDKKRKKPFAAVNSLIIDQATVFISDENTRSSFEINELNTSFSDLSLREEHLTGQITALNYHAPQFEDIEEVRATFSLSPSSIEIPNLSLKSTNASLDAAIVVTSPQWTKAAILENGRLDIQVNQADFATEIFRANEKYLPKGSLRLSGRAQGPLSQLDLRLFARTNNNSVFEGDLLIDMKSTEEISILGKQFSAALNPKDIKRYREVFLPANTPLQHLDLEQFLVNGSFVYDHQQSLNSSLTLTLNQGELGSNTRLTKKKNTWLLTQQFKLSQLGKGALFRAQPLLEEINGYLNLKGEIIEKKLNQLNWESHFNTVVWDQVTYNEIQLNGSSHHNQLDLFTQVDDDRVKLNASLRQGLNGSQNQLLIQSAIDRIDLSAFGWTAPQAAVDLSTELTIKGTTDALEEIRLENTQIKNKDTKSSFNDFSLFFKRDQNRNTIIQETSDLFQFSLEGDFNYQNLPRIVENALREAVLLPIKTPTSRKEQFTFELAFNTKTLQALYPAIDTPDNITLKGEISTVKGASSFSFDLPFISYQGYDIKGLSIVTSANAIKDRTRFKAENLSGKNIFISNVALTTSQGQDRLAGEFKGQFGRETENSFSLNFTYRQAPTNSLFQLEQALIDLDGDQWRLSPNQKNRFLYDSKMETFTIQGLALTTSDQSINIDGKYQSKNNFNLQLVTNQLSLQKILPKGDKFNFEGDLSSNISIVQNDAQQIFQTDLTIDGLVINSASMGDFSLNAGGSSQLKTYQLNSTLVHEGRKTLQAFGNIYTPSTTARLDIDLDLNDFNLAFLSALGKDKLTGIKGFLKGKLNLWGTFDDIKINGLSELNQWEMFIPSTNARYALEEGTVVRFQDRLIQFNNARLLDTKSKTQALLNGNLRHINFNAWEMDLGISTNRFLVYDRPEDENALFYGHGYLSGEARFTGPTKSLKLEVEGSTSEGTTLVIPWQEDKGLSDTSFIDFLPKGVVVEEEVTADISAVDEAFRGFEMVFDLDVNRNAEVEIVVDQSSGSTLSGRGAGNILIETNIDGKFNIWGDFIAYDGIYNFKNLGLIDKKFAVEQGGTIVWEGDPLEAQLNIEATYQVPGGANPALLVDNPNFNRKIPTNVEIQLVGNLIKPDDPVFDISFPNTTGIVVSEINYRLADQQRRQLQAISLLSQGIFISDVSVSLQGITNNLYEKASDVFSTLLGSNEGKLNVGLNYLQGEENPAFDLRTEDRIGLTLSTQISDRILINGKIGVPIDGVEQSVIVGDVQIDFILNESGSLKAKVFNRENDFRYLGDEFGYTQGMGMSYQVDFNTFQELLQKITSKATESSQIQVNPPISSAIDFLNKEN
ncbi:MAG: translocation/assembly module TamB domain-containing protein [Flavobacteriaceae bacterium]